MDWKVAFKSSKKTVQWAGWNWKGDVEKLEGVQGFAGEIEGEFGGSGCLSCDLVDDV